MNRETLSVTTSIVAAWILIAGSWLVDFPVAAQLIVTAAIVTICVPLLVHDTRTWLRKRNNHKQVQS